MNATPTPDQAKRSTRRTTAIGVTAGLLAGGAIGLVAAAPGFSSAAADTVAVVVEQDADTPPADEVERPEPGERLRELLQGLVDDGTLTADQADTVADYLVENRPERGDRGGRRGHRPGMDGEVVAGLIGIDVDELRDALRNGSTIADIAAINGVDAETVIDALVAEGQAHLDLAVESGRLTDDEAAEKAEALEERVTARVNGERPQRDG
jgi:hypothetical protein